MEETMKSASAVDVTIYTTPTCAYCKLAKEFFKEHNIAYAEKNVMADQAAREEMMKKSNSLSVPVIDIGGEIVIGFDKEKLSRLLRIS